LIGERNTPRTHRSPYSPISPAAARLLSGVCNLTPGGRSSR
jgi:hypothetical protein